MKYTSSLCVFVLSCTAASFLAEFYGECRVGNSQDTVSVEAVVHTVDASAVISGPTNLKLGPVKPECEGMPKHLY